MEELIRDQPGVKSTVVGCSGGNVKGATYRNHGTHQKPSLLNLIQTTYPFPQLPSLKLFSRKPKSGTILLTYSSDSLKSIYGIIFTPEN